MKKSNRNGLGLTEGEGEGWSSATDLPVLCVGYPGSVGSLPAWSQTPAEQDLARGV